MDELEFLSKTSGEPGVIQPECYFIGPNLGRYLLDDKAKASLGLRVQLYVTRRYGVKGFILGQFIEYPDSDIRFDLEKRILFIDDPEKLDMYDKSLNEGKIKVLKNVNLLENTMDELRYYGEIYNESFYGLVHLTRSLEAFHR